MLEGWHSYNCCCALFISLKSSSFKASGTVITPVVQHEETARSEQEGHDFCTTFPGTNRGVVVKERAGGLQGSSQVKYLLFCFTMSYSFLREE